MPAPLWDPEELRSVRRINRGTLATAIGFLLLGGLAALLGSSEAALGLITASVLAFAIGSFAAMSATSAGRCLL